MDLIKKTNNNQLIIIFFVNKMSKKIKRLTNKLQFYMIKLDKYRKE